jgi:hypothetical protein
VRICKIFCLMILLFFPLAASGNRPVCLTIGTDTLGVMMPENIPTTLDRVLKQWTGNGYPYAELVLSAYHGSSDTVHVTYRLIPGESVHIDTVVFGKFTPVEVHRLQRLIRDDLTGPYNIQRIRQAQNRLNQSPWLKTVNRHDISDSALRFYAERVEDFSFDALLSYQNRAGGLVGQADIGLVNFLGLGRQADFSWYHPSERTNRVTVNWFEPYLLNTGFSAGLRFRQEHEDTLYVTRESRFKLIWENRVTDVGLVISREDVYTTDAGDSAGVIEGTRHISALNLRLEDITRQAWQYRLSVTGGIRTGEDSLQYPMDYEAEIRIRNEPWYVWGKLLGGRVFSKGDLAGYQQFRLGGGTFLRGAFFEQYRVDWYTGGILEGGVDDGLLRAGLFVDWAWMEGISGPLIHAGTSLSLPAGTSRLKILLGFDVQEPQTQGKIHVGWTF